MSAIVYFGAVRVVNCNEGLVRSRADQAINTICSDYKEVLELWVKYTEGTKVCMSAPNQPRAARRRSRPFTTRSYWKRARTAMETFQAGEGGGSGTQR